MSWILAIDFGTTNTAAAIQDEAGNVRPVQLESNSTTMPSAVSMDPSGVSVGQRALNGQAIHPEWFVAAPKKLIGHGPQVIDGQFVEPESIAAEIFRRVRDEALAVMDGQAPAGVVITHPESWGSDRTSELKRAASAAGFAASSVRLVSEPIAAAHHYARARDVPSGTRIAVFDFGGGTLDVAILERDPSGPSEYKVLGAGGDGLLGGDDFDEKLWRWVLDQLRSKGHTEAVDALEGLDGVETPDRLRDRLTLRRSVRAAKEELSRHSSSVIPVAITDVNTTVTITRDEYEELITPEVQQAVRLAFGVLARSGVDKPDLLYLTGGSSRTPLVARALSATVGMTASKLDDPKLVVAQGALRVPVTKSETTTKTKKPRRWRIVVAVASAVIVVAATTGLGLWLMDSTKPHPTPSPLPNPVPSSSSPPPARTVTCWDGNKRPEGECADLTGQAALTWLFPTEPAADGSKAYCEVQDASDVELPTGVTELKVCSWNDLDHSIALMYQFSKGANLENIWENYHQALYPRGYSSKPAQNDEGTLSLQSWKGVDYLADDQPRRIGLTYSYLSAPFAVELVTLDPGVVTSDEHDLLASRVHFREDKFVDEALASSEGG